MIVKKVEEGKVAEPVIEVPKIIITSSPMTPLPKQEAPVQIKVEVDDFKQSVLYVLYILYKGNMISRHNLKDMIRVMSEKVPDQGVAKYLVDEAAKA